MGNVYDANGKKGYSRPSVSKGDWFQEHHLFQAQIPILQMLKSLILKVQNNTYIHI